MRGPILKPGFALVAVAAGLAGFAVLAPARTTAAPVQHPNPRDSRGDAERPPRAPVVEAVRIEAASPELDGRLNEPIWRGTSLATGFIQREPLQGEPAPEATEVRFAYDEDALWIGARMHSRDPAAIVALATRRDREGSSEQLVVSLDTYHDRRTAYTFAVTAAGVRIDYYHGSDSEGSRDYGYDPVWEAATAIDAQGWVAEIRIPFAQLRFSPAEQQVWGVNLVRHVPTRNEASYWRLVRRDQTGWASRMGTLAGIRDIRPARGIEVLPYLAADARLSTRVDAADPFAEERAADFRAGADVKIGLGSSLTLDATFNPDFGQVEADPAEVNLTAFETRFDERRPFFTEGSQLFGGRNFFYSRRIGAPPGEPDADYAEDVDETRILGAAKLTGRLPSGLSIGALGAVTGQTEVATFDDEVDEFGRAVVAPLTGYAVATVQQEFGRDASTLSATLTAVERDLEPGSPLAALLTRAANSGMIDGSLRWAGGEYDFGFYLGFTHVRGDSAAILRLQRSSVRYWQRPDAEHVSVDPGRTSLAGIAWGISHSRNQGEHWLWDINYYEESPGLDKNDIGSLVSTDDRSFSASLRYRETQPGRWLRGYSIGLRESSDWNYAGDHHFTRLAPSVNATFPNFWEISFDGELSSRGLSEDLSRGGPLMQTGRSWTLGAALRSPGGARNQWAVEWGMGADELGGRSFRVEGGVSLRPGDRWELSFDPRWIDQTEARQFITALDGGRSATFGRRYIFAAVDRREFAAQLRLNYTFTPDLTLELYAEPFVASGRFHGLGELEAARSRELIEYGTGLVLNEDGSRTVSAGGDTFTLADRDFNVQSFRSNAVLRWEWRPGSTAFLVWQQDRFADRIRGTARAADLWDGVRAPGDHFLALKVSYWVPIR